MFFWVGMRRCVPACFAVGQVLTLITVNGGGGDRLHRPRHDGQKACINTQRSTVHYRRTSLLYDNFFLRRTSFAVFHPHPASSKEPPTSPPMVLRSFPPPDKALNVLKVIRSVSSRVAIFLGSTFCGYQQFRRSHLSPGPFAAAGICLLFA